MKNTTGNYLVQVGRGEKGSYKTRYELEKRGQAIMYYNGINIGRGYKKRLIDPDGKILDRQFS